MVVWEYYVRGGELIISKQLRFEVSQVGFGDFLGGQGPPSNESIRIIYVWREVLDASFHWRFDQLWGWNNIKIMVPCL